MKRQPVITGLGIVSPIGVGVEKFWAAACAGKSGISTPTSFDATMLPADCRVVGEVKDFDPLGWMPARMAKTAGRFRQFAAAAAKMARLDAGLDTADLPPEQLKVSLRTSMTGRLDLGESTLGAVLQGRAGLA